MLPPSALLPGPAAHRMVLLVRKRIQGGMGRFCLAFLACGRVEGGCSVFGLGLQQRQNQGRAGREAPKQVQHQKATHQLLLDGEALLGRLQHGRVENKQSRSRKGEQAN